MASSGVRRILITGATGKQGGAVLRALLSHPDPTLPLEFYALTRKATSPSAQRLAQDPRVSIIEGDLKDCESIFHNLPHPVWGVFGVTLPLPNDKVEEARGKALADTAAKNGVQHFVFTSVERGANGNTDPTVVPHFRSKFEIEQHIKKVAKESKQGMKWTFLQPVAFMDNLTPDFFGKVFVTLWRKNGWESKLQLISSRDVGIVGADAFLKPEEYEGKALSLATDEISLREANEIFKEQEGRDLPGTYEFVGSTIKWLLKEQLGKMFDWFVSDGFAADAKAIREKYPGTQDFRTWLKETSKFAQV
ncbi:MAG: hypothetical protein M1820_000073 [Bogoriella megaspora]|nr:MAG: hypothetical protein M1820_000073 [Bogoriella megaspora]